MTSDVTSIAVLGAGRMGRLYAQLVEQHPLTRLAALTCRTDASADRLRSDFDAPVFASKDPDVLAPIVDEINAVIIAAPEWAHLAPVRWSADNGLPTLLEKPMAGGLDEALAVAEAGAVLGDRLMLCHVVRFDPRYSTMRNAVAEGAIGRVRQMYARRNADQKAAQRILGKCHPAFWLTPHDVDIMRWITGAEVEWLEARYAASGEAKSDGLFVDLGFSDGSYGRIENSWGTPPLPAPRNCFFDVAGEDGSIEVSAWEQGIAVHYGDGRVALPNTTEVCEVDGRIVGAFANMIDTFVDVASGLRSSPAILADGLATMQVADAIAKSLSSGRRTVV